MSWWTDTSLLLEYTQEKHTQTLISEEQQRLYFKNEEQKGSTGHSWVLPYLNCQKLKQVFLSANPPLVSHSLKISAKHKGSQRTPRMILLETALRDERRLYPLFSSSVAVFLIWLCFVFKLLPLFNGKKLATCRTLPHKFFFCLNATNTAPMGKPVLRTEPFASFLHLLFKIKADYRERIARKCKDVGMLKVQFQIFWLREKFQLSDYLNSETGTAAGELSGKFSPVILIFL